MAAATRSSQPRTAAGRALVEWAETAYPGQDQVRIWREHALAIEAEAAGSSAQPAPDVLDLLRAAYDYMEDEGWFAAVDPLLGIQSFPPRNDPTSDEIREYRLDATDPEMARLNWQEFRAHKAASASPAGVDE